MTDPKTAAFAVESLTDLPMQPTGSGIADLEIAYEQMKLTENAGPDGAPDVAGEIGDIIAGAESDAAASGAEEDVAETVAHPS